MAKKYVIIGGAAAGPKAASKIRRLDQTAEITIIQKGNYLSMASCGYPYFVGGLFEDENKLISTSSGIPRDSNYFAEVKNIKAITNTEAIKIDRFKKTVLAKNIETKELTEYSYDKLLIATGAKPIIPDLPGKELKCITSLHDLENARFLKDLLKTGNVKEAVIIGGGLIGIETAEALLLGGVKVTIIEKLTQLLPFLDWEMAKLVENHIRGKGSEVLTECSALEFIGEKGVVKAVKTSCGQTIPCDLALIAVGVKPDSILAEVAGLKVGDTGGIRINKFMQTNDVDIYAAGDCVEITDLVTQNKTHWPMGDAANLQARVAAQNMVFGNNAEYNGALMTGVCKVFEFNAGSTGLSETRARKEGYTNIITSVHAGTDKPDYTGGKMIIMKMVADKTTGRLLGVQAVGPGDVSKRLSVAAMALYGRMHITDLLTLDLPYAPPFSQAIDNFISAAHVLENKWLGRLDGISAASLRQKVIDRENIFMLDVRSPEEYSCLKLNLGEVLIPLNELHHAQDKLPQDKATEIIVWCRISLRGYEASCWLRSIGYEKVKVLEGGISAWSYPLGE